LEDLDAKIKRAEASIRKDRARQQSFGFTWILYSSLVYLVVSAITFYFFPADSDLRLLRFLPAIIGPFM